MNDNLKVNQQQILKMKYRRVYQMSVSSSWLFEPAVCLELLEGISKEKQIKNRCWLWGCVQGKEEATTGKRKTSIRKRE